MRSTFASNLLNVTFTRLVRCETRAATNSACGASCASRLASLLVLVRTNNMKFRSFFVVLAACAPVFAGCAGATEATPDDAEIGADQSALTNAGLVTVGGVQVLRLVNASNQVVLQLNPSAFSALLVVPDFVNGGNGSSVVTGTQFLGVAVNPNNGVVAVAVRGTLIAEVHIDMVFRIFTNSAAFLANPSAPSNLKLLPFDGLSNSGILATNTMLTRPFTDIRRNGPAVSYSSNGRLTVKTADADANSYTIVYQPNARLFSCVRVGTASPPRCPVTAP
jgi:hypothetical protein